MLGDTNSCLAAIAAKRRKIPVFHMEAGNRCFDDRVPEEINRRIVDHITDINLPYSEIAREYLLREGLPPDRVIKTGSPMYEVLDHYRPRIDGVGRARAARTCTDGTYFVVSAHREENVDSPEQPVAPVRRPERAGRTLRHAGHRLDASAHRASGSRRLDLRRLDGGCSSSSRSASSTTCSCRCDARAVLSDSGTITEESSILNFPALNIRDAHERPEGMEEAAVMMVGLEPARASKTRSTCWKTSRAASSACSIDGPGLRPAQRLGQGAPDHPELHRLREPQRCGRRNDWGRRRYARTGSILQARCIERRHWLHRQCPAPRAREA